MEEGQLNELMLIHTTIGSFPYHVILSKGSCLWLSKV